MYSTYMLFYGIGFHPAIPAINLINPIHPRKTSLPIPHPPEQSRPSIYLKF